MNTTRSGRGCCRAPRGTGTSRACSGPDELSEQIPGLTVPDEAAYETVGGYVMSQLGRIAAVGDTVDVGGGTLSVTRMDGRRIDRICFRPARVPRRGQPAGQAGAA